MRMQKRKRVWMQQGGQTGLEACAAQANVEGAALRSKRAQVPAWPNDLTTTSASSWHAAGGMMDGWPGGCGCGWMAQTGRTRGWAGGGGRSSTEGAGERGPNAASGRVRVRGVRGRGREHSPVRRRPVVVVHVVQLPVVVCVKGCATACLGSPSRKLNLETTADPRTTRLAIKPRRRMQVPAWRHGR